MRTHEGTGRAPAIGSLFALILAMTGCTQAPNLTVVEAERAKPVLRFDTFQSAANNGKVLVVGSADGALVTSTDRGATWRRQQLPSPASIIALTQCPDGSFAGLDFYRKVWIGDASGEQWASRDIKTANNVLALACDAGNRLWVVGSRTSIQSSADKGASWQVIDLGEDAILTTVQFLDAKRGVITGEFGILVTTVDGGATWQQQARIPGDFYPYSAAFTDTRHGWVSGLAGVILYTGDGGKTWTKQANQTGAPMYGLVKAGEEIYGLGAGGLMVILRGNEWLRFNHGKAVPAYLVAGVAIDAQSLLVTGAAGVIHVVNAGEGVRRRHPIDERS
jgi:photosystem II stability/assembly factor-like uncharacterized protein